MSRYHLSDVLRHPDRVSVWWDDLPYFRRGWWNEVLWSPGEGWLRWSPDWRERISYEPPDIDQWQVFPPLHRAWLAIYGFTRISPPVANWAGRTGRASRT